MNPATLFGARNVLVFSLVAEAATGLAVIAAPALVAQLLFGSGVAGAGIVYGRVLGLTLLALVIACWPGAGVPRRPAMRAMLAYNVLAAAYLAYLGAGAQPVGILLWPAVAEHALVALLLAARSRNGRAPTASEN